MLFSLHAINLMACVRHVKDKEEERKKKKSCTFGKISKVRNGHTAKQYLGKSFTMIQSIQSICELAAAKCIPSNGVAR